MSALKAQLRQANTDANEAWHKSNALERALDEARAEMQNAPDGSAALAARTKDGKARDGGGRNPDKDNKGDELLPSDMVRSSASCWLSCEGCSVGGVSSLRPRLS